MPKQHKVVPVRVTVGIAAYNAEGNIRALLESLLSQSDEMFVLEQILVYSDCSSDTTVSQSRSLHSALVKVVQGRVRRGFAGSLSYLLAHSESDLTVILNDDILITDSGFLGKIVDSYCKNPQAGLICGNPQPIQSPNFISSAIASSFYAYYRMALSVNEGNCMHTYDGKVMAVTRQFRESLVLPKNLQLMGNVDSFIYFSCLSLGFSYRFVQDAIVYYVNPTNFRDYLRWYIRNNANESVMRQQFGELIDKEYRKPRIVFIYYLFLEFLKNPLGGLFLFVTGFYIRFAAKSYAKNFKQTWEVVTSTKTLLKI